MKRLSNVLKLVLLFLIISSSLFAQDPPQYGTPFNKVPDPSDAIFYQVNTRAYSVSGNFKGVIERLDYLKGLGINVIYLMPIYPVGVLKSVNSPYCVKDYKSVGAEFGNLDDLRVLVDKAHEKGMAVMLDWVANHTSWDHTWMSNKSWYVQDGSGNVMQAGDYPDVAQLNFNNTDMRKAMIDALRYWVFAANIDGFRFDFANNVPYDFWKQTIDSLRGISTHKLLLLAEGTRTDHFTAGFDFIYGMNFYWNAIKPIYTLSKTALSIATSNTTEYTNANSNQEVVRYLTNHDVNNAEGSILELYKSLKGSLAAFVATAYMKGAPMVYTGQEVAHPDRILFPFTNVKIDWNINTDYREEYAKILNYKKSSVALRKGTLIDYGNKDICAFTKEKDGERVLVISNLRNKSITFTLPVGISNTVWQDAFADTSVSIGTSLVLSAYEYKILKAHSSVVAVGSISIDQDSVATVQSYTKQLTVTFTPETATDQKIIWSSANEAIAKVSPIGLILGISEGVTTIYATSHDGGKKDSCKVSVKYIPVSSITLDPSSATVNLGTNRQLIAVIKPDSASIKTVNWVSSDTTIAKVNSTGYVTSVAEGSAVISATTVDGNKLATCNFQINSPREFTVHCLKPSDWGTAMKIYYWLPDPAGSVAPVSWPGVPMTFESNGWYKFTFVNVNAINLIFNAGTKQTANLWRDKDGWYMNDVWYDENPQSSINKTEFSKVNVYPNPVIDNKITIEPTGNNHSEFIVSASDLSGKIIFEQKITSKTTLNTNLASGAYLLTLKNNEFVEVKKLLVK